MSNVCIVGQKGFIGSKLLLDVNFTKNHNIFTLESNLLNKESLLREISSFPNIDTLIFLVGGFGNNFNDLINVNLLTLSNCLEFLNEKGLKNIVFTSTGAVYGEPVNSKSRETDRLSPNSIYGLSKIYSEELLKYYFENKGISVFILRFPNVYGPGNNKGVIYSFLNSIFSTKYIVFEGDGNEKRNFLYVDDAVKSIILSLEKIEADKKIKKFEILNVSDEKIYTLIQLSEILKDLGLVFEIKKSNKSNLNSIKTLSLSNKKLKKTLGWVPEISLVEGIKKLYLLYNIEMGGGEQAK